MVRLALRMLLALATACAAATSSTALEGSVRPGGVGFSLTAPGRFCERLLAGALQRRPRSCVGLRASKAMVSPSGATATTEEGADAHWKNFIRGQWGDFHGRFCRWDPASCDLLVETHLLRSYHVQEQDGEPFLRQQNKIFFDDGREPVSRGPWDVTKACSTERGIVHPRVGQGESGTTFLITPGSAQATAWAVHTIKKSDPLLNPGVVPLGGKGHEGQGYMVEMIVSHGEHVRLSIGYVYDDEKGALQHVTFNREDSRGWPSEYWSTDTAMRTIKPDQVAAVAGVATGASGTGHQIEIPVSSESGPNLVQLPITDVPWDTHLRSLTQANTAVFELPDNLVMIVPRAIPWGEAWAASYVWRPSDAPVVHSLETRYLASGDFDCFRHVEFRV